LSVIAGEMNLKVCELTKSPRYALSLDLRHVAGYALTTGAAVLVVSVFLQCRGVRAIGRRWPMTIQAQLVYWLSELRIVLSAMHIVAGRACDTVLVHHALHKVITLHPVLMRGSVREVRERRMTHGDVFELPVVCQMKTAVVANRPIIGFTLDLFGERLPLRMALNAGVICGYVIHLRRIKDVVACGMGDVLLPGPWQRSQPTFHSVTCLV
jgi:hypothetical protein